MITVTLSGKTGSGLNQRLIDKIQEVMIKHGKSFEIIIENGEGRESITNLILT